MSDVDVRIDDLPRLKVDCKAYKAFAHHTLFNEVRAKYCKEPGDIPILITKASRQVGSCVTMDMEFFTTLLKLLREHEQSVSLSQSQSPSLSR